MANKNKIDIMKKSTGKIDSDIASKKKSDLKIKTKGLKY